MKIVILSLLIMCLVIFLHAVSASMAPEEDEDLVLYFTFEDTDEPEDFSPNESPIDSYGEPAELVSGFNGKAWLFDKSTFILLSDQTFNAAFTQSTFSVWLKEPGGDGIIYEEGGATHGYAVTMIGGEVHFATRSNSLQTTLEAEYPDDGRWHFITTVFNEEIMEIYIDGEMMGEESGLTGISSHSDEMGIGRVNGDSSGGVNSQFTGIMDEFRITRRAITEEEIQGIYQKSIAIEPSGRSYTTWGGVRDIHR